MEEAVAERGLSGGSLLLFFLLSYSSYLPRFFYNLFTFSFSSSIPTLKVFKRPISFVFRSWVREQARASHCRSGQRG